MKTITIEQVDNGYIVSNKPEKEPFSACVPFSVCVDSGIHVFETFHSMAYWLKDHFEPSKTNPIPPPIHLGTDET